MRIDRAVVFSPESGSQLEPAKALDGSIVSRAKPILRVEIENLALRAVGEIQDEHDVEVDSVAPHVDGSIGIDASVSVRELNERLSLNIPETGQYVTLAGFLLAKTGHLMKEGEEVAFEDSIFRVEQMIGRRIMRVRLTRTAPVSAQKPA